MTYGSTKTEVKLATIRICGVRRIILWSRSGECADVIVAGTVVLMLACIPRVTCRLDHLRDFRVLIGEVGLDTAE